MREAPFNHLESTSSELTFTIILAHNYHLFAHSLWAGKKEERLIPLPMIGRLDTSGGQVDAKGGLCHCPWLQRGGTAPERPGDVDTPSKLKRVHPRLLHLLEVIRL